MTGKSFINSKWRGRILRYAPLILWVCVIFFMSSGQAAMSETSRFIRPLLEWIFPLAAPETITIYHGYIRKFAHFFEYAVLAFWGWLAFNFSSIGFLQKYWYIFSFAFVVFVALLDETNQSFNVNRTGSLYDVLLDAGGGLTMILLLYGVGRKDKK